MPQMSSLDAAERLGVSQRQVQRLVRSGALTATTTVGNALVVDPLSVSARNRETPTRGRPWSPAVAWGALWRISGKDATWLTYSQRRRLNQRLDGIRAAPLIAAVRGRATVSRYRAGTSAALAIAHELWLTAASAPEASALASATNAVDGYCTAYAARDMITRFALAPDPFGAITLRVPTLPGLPFDGPLPTAVVAVDLAGSSESREREIAQQMLDDLLS